MCIMERLDMSIDQELVYVLAEIFIVTEYLPESPFHLSWSSMYRINSS